MFLKVLGSPETLFQKGFWWGPGAKPLADKLQFTYNTNYTYYIGVFGGSILENINVEFYRKITNSQNLIITDPSSGYECGSEVTLNNGLYLGNTLTEGYTRCLFFENGGGKMR